MKYDYVTDEQLADFNQYPCPTAGCTSCSIAAELASRRPTVQERMHIADLLPTLGEFPAVQAYLERQIARPR